MCLYDFFHTDRLRRVCQSPTSTRNLEAYRWLKTICSPTACPNYISTFWPNLTKEAVVAFEMSGKYPSTYKALYPLEFDITTVATSHCDTVCAASCTALGLSVRLLQSQLHHWQTLSPYTVPTVQLLEPPFATVIYLVYLHTLYQFSSY